MKNILESLTQSEKNRILEMHKTATMKHYLNEQMVSASEPAQPKVKDIPEITVSAWLPLDNAKRTAKERGGNILVYFYNDGCDACEDYTKNVMQNNEIRKKITDSNLTLSKMIMCPDSDDGGYLSDATKQKKYFKPCDESQLSSWNSFKFKDNIYAVPAVILLSSDGETIISGPFFGARYENSINNLINLSSEDLGSKM
jgi:thioredoxin-related protein